VSTRLANGSRMLLLVVAIAALAGCCNRWSTPTATGGVLWVHQFGTQERDAATDIAVDGAGNVLVSGITSGDLAGRNHGDDAILRKLTSAGRVVWTRQYGTPRDHEYAYGIAVDAAGYIATVGETDWVSTIVRRFDAAGNALWSARIALDDETYGEGVAVDEGRDVIVVGSVEIDDTYVAYVGKFGPDGTRLWLQLIEAGVRTATYGSGVAVDGGSNVIIVGVTTGDLADPLFSRRASDAFVRKLDSDGNERWTRQLGTSEGDRAVGVAVDREGNIVVAGTTGGGLVGANRGETDVFASKYDADGDEVWARQLGTSKRDVASGVAVDGHGDVYVSGRTSGWLARVPRQDDAFVVKLRR